MLVQEGTGGKGIRVTDRTTGQWRSSGELVEVEAGAVLLDSPSGAGAQGIGDVLADRFDKQLGQARDPQRHAHGLRRIDDVEGATDAGQLFVKLDQDRDAGGAEEAQGRTIKPDVMMAFAHDVGQGAIEMVGPVAIEPPHYGNVKDSVAGDACDLHNPLLSLAARPSNAVLLSPRRTRRTGGRILFRIETPRPPRPPWSN